MVRANNIYIVPAEDQAEDHFFAPLPAGRLMVQLPLHINKVETVLRPLAIWLNFPGASEGKKVVLLTGIQENLSLIPMADAVVRWPSNLADIPATKMLQRASLSMLTCADEAKTFSRDSELSIFSLRRYTPEFIPHLHARMAQLEAAIQTN